MDTMNRRKALGLTAGGVAAAAVVGSVAAAEQAPQKQQREAKISSAELKGSHEKAVSPPERVESKALTHASNLAFVSGSSDIFMVAHHNGGVVLNLQGEIAANHAAAQEDEHFYYLTMNTSGDLPHFAIAKKAGWTGKHLVWSRHGNGAWSHYERATKKQLEGNMVV